MMGQSSCITPDAQTQLISCCQYLASVCGLAAGYGAAEETDTDLSHFLDTQFPLLTLENRSSPHKLSIVHSQTLGFCVLLPSDNTETDMLYVPKTGMVRADGQAFDTYRVIMDEKAAKKHAAPPGNLAHLMWFIGKLWFKKGVLAEILLALCFINLFVIALPFFTINVYDKVVPNFATSTLLALTIGVVSVIGFDFLFKLAKSRMLERINAQNNQQLSHAFLDSFFYKNTDKSRSSTDHINIYKELLSGIDFITTRLLPSILEVPFSLVFLVIMYMISPAISLVPLTAMLILMIGGYVSKINMRHVSAEKIDKSNALFTNLHEKIVNKEVIRTNGNPRFFRAMWQHLTRQHAQASSQYKIRTTLFNDFCYSIIQLQTVCVIIIGVFEIHAGNLTIGALIGCSILSARTVSPTLAFGSALSFLPQLQQSLLPIRQQLETSQATPPLTHHPKFTGKLECKNVSLQFPGQLQPALADISLTLPAGTKVGLIGANGSGKTSLIKAILGLETITSGTVLLDGINAAQADPLWRNQSIGYVPQESAFIKASLLDNIQMGRTNISPGTLDRILHISGVSRFLSQTGQGLDSAVLENGINLSGGQKQSLTIARALYHDPQLLILDEPTSGMEHGLEQHVQQNLQAHLNGKTVLLSTHRRPMLKLVEHVIVMDKGRITATGSREELMQTLQTQGV